MAGLKQKILMATSEKEVEALLSEGKTYEFASTKTRNSWKHAAKRALDGKKYIPTTIAGGVKKATKARRSR